MNDPLLAAMPSEHLRSKLSELGGASRLDRSMKEFGLTRDQIRAMGLHIYRQESNRKWMVSLSPPAAKSTPQPQGGASKRAGKGGVDSCQLCAKGQCWKHGGKGSCKGGKTNQMMQMMQMMMAQWSGAPPCKWCQLGQCWTHAGMFGACKGKGGFARTRPYTAPADIVCPATEREIDTFLSVHTVQPHAVQMFRRLDPKLKRLVIDKGSMLDARDQTAVLVKRINDVSSMKRGDWVCPRCLDHQFASNMACRKCGADKPLAGL